MSQLPVIFRREYVERVRSRSFVLSTILTPVFLTLFALGPALTDRLRSDDRSYHFMVVDESEEVGPRVVQLLNAPRESGGGRITADGGLGPSTDTQPELEVRAQTGAIDGYVWIPWDVTDAYRFELHVRPDVPASTRRELTAVVSSAVQYSRLLAAGVPEAEVSTLFEPVVPQLFTIEADGDPVAPEEGGLGLALTIGFVLYTLILLYGTQVLHSVQEEKNTRIAEVLVTSVHPTELMLGKVFGVGAAALTQLAVWTALGRSAYAARSTLAGLGIPVDALELFATDFGAGTLARAALFLLLGFFLYATLFAAVGAAAGSTEDAQRFTFPLIIPLFVPMFLAEVIIGEPRGTVARVLGWLPLTAPVVVPMRIGANGISAVEIGASLAILAASVLAVGWAAGKIYRVGILMTGSRPGLRDLVRWVRAA